MTALLLKLLIYYHLHTTTTSTIDCITIIGLVTSFEGSLSNASCPFPYTLTSCGFKNKNTEFGSVDGSFIINDICYAKHATNSSGVSAHARCCELSSYNMQCNTYQSNISETADDSTTSIACPLQNEKLMGCTANTDGGVTDGVQSGTYPWSTIQTILDTENTCTAHNGAAGTGVWSWATCCYSQDISVAFNCVRMRGNRAGGTTGNTSIIDCSLAGSDYFLTSCTGIASWKNTYAWYSEDGSSDTCIVTNHQSPYNTNDNYYVIADVICCQVTTQSPTLFPTQTPSVLTLMPTLFPTKYPILRPSISPITSAPSGNPSNYPSQSPSNNPSQTPSNYSSYIPSNYASISPSQSPSITEHDRSAEHPESTETINIKITNKTRKQNGFGIIESNWSIFSTLFVIIIILIVFSMVLCLVIFIRLKRNKNSNRTGTIMISSESTAVSVDINTQIELTNQQKHIINTSIAHDTKLNSISNINSNDLNNSSSDSEDVYNIKPASNTPVNGGNTTVGDIKEKHKLSKNKQDDNIGENITIQHNDQLENEKDEYEDLYDENNDGITSMGSATNV
eukprot:402579_1